MHPAGTKMLEKPPCDGPESCAKGHCGTRNPGWMNGTLPMEHGQTLEATACFVCYGRYCKGTCFSKIPIRVRSCGDFYIYELKDVYDNSRAYCAA